MSSAVPGAKVALDPALSALFAASSGPVKVHSQILAKRVSTAARPDTSKSDSTSSSEGADEEGRQAIQHVRKRRKLDKSEHLESDYFNRLAQEEEREQQQAQAEEQDGAADASDDESETSTEDVATLPTTTPDGYEIPLHETMTKLQTRDEQVDDVKRTVFLGNVSNGAIKSKTDKKLLIAHLESVLSTKEGQVPIGKLKSLRFRSTAFVSGSGPKRATFAKKELMEETTNNTNAYAVFTTDEAARKVASALNGSVILDRHLRADYLGKPSQVDYRRCVFVGNLSFVDEETPDDPIGSSDGNKKRPRGKVPADVEEGLWQTFARAGKVESVRVIRDKETRVGKGFAYVQFEDETAVEAALLLNEKKFPPMLPRKLRVTRARRSKQAYTARPDVSKGASRSGPYRGQIRRETSSKLPGQKSKIIFEGHRASSNSNKFAFKQKKSHKAKPTTRSSRRGAAYKAAGSKKNFTRR